MLAVSKDKMASYPGLFEQASIDIQGWTVYNLDEWRESHE